MTAPRTTYDGEPIAEEPPFGATVVVYRRVDDGVELLVLHRAHEGPEYEGDWAWTPPAGARKPGEDLGACALRELKEETGLAIPIRPTALAGDWPAFEAEVPAGATIVLDAEHDRFVWLTPGEAVARCKPAIVAEQIRAALRQIETPLNRADAPGVGDRRSADVSARVRRSPLTASARRPESPVER